MNTAEGMADLAAEAERQGFPVSQTKSGMWKFVINGHTHMYEPTDQVHLLKAISALESAGFDVSKLRQ